MPPIERGSINPRMSGWVKHGNAFKYQFYPGAALEDSQTVVFEVCIAPLESESDVELTSIDTGVFGRATAGGMSSPSSASPLRWA